MNRRGFLRGLAAIAAPAIVTSAGFRAGLWLPPPRQFVGFIDEVRIAKEWDFSGDFTIDFWIKPTTGELLHWEQNFQAPTVEITPVGDNNWHYVKLAGKPEEINAACEARGFPVQLLPSGKDHHAHVTDRLIIPQEILADDRAHLSDIDPDEFQKFSLQQYEQRKKHRE